ncbi:MAG: heavy metal translocating P-type ATPase [bacterium]|nr:heavy metal translocating P-type ATPase [bacterium]
MKDVLHPFELSPTDTKASCCAERSTVYEILDEPRTAAKFVEERDATHVSCTFTVPVIHCASCVWTLERLPQVAEGIHSSVVDLTRKTVRIAYNPKKTSVRQLAELLTSLNFPPLLEGKQESTPHVSRTTLQRLGVAGFSAANIMLFSIAAYLAGPAGLPPSLDTAFRIISIILAIPVVLFSAAPWWKSALGSLRHRTINLDVPVALGIAAIFTRSIVDIVTNHGFGYLDSFTGLVFFLLIGRLVQEKAFQAISFDRTVRSFFPLGVRVVRKDVNALVPIESIAVGDVLDLRNGEVLPCDATLVSPTSQMDYSFVTGEHKPHACVKGEVLMAGGKVIGTSMRCLVISDVSHGHLASLWERNSAPRPRTQLIDVSSRFGAVFTLVTVLIALTAFAVWLPDMAMASNVLIAVLIIACPCAMTLAAPIALGTAMGLLGRKGIMIRNTGTLLELERATHIVFDKTGTLTTLHYEATYVGIALSSDEQDAVAAIVSESTHPVSKALAVTFGISTLQAQNVQEIPGQGIHGTVDKHSIAVGSEPWVLQWYGQSAAAHTLSNRTLIAIDGHIKGEVVVGSSLRKGVPEMICDVRERLGTSMVSGDGTSDRSLLEPFFAEKEMHFGMLPAEKVKKITELQARGERVLMVGDGLNDAAAMNTANVAIAVSNDTSTIVPACDVILPGTMMSSIPTLLRYARTIRGVIIATFAVSLVYNAIGITLAVTGALSPLAVAILMPISSLTVIGLAVAGAHLAVRREQWK